MQSLKFIYNWKRSYRTSRIANEGRLNFIDIGIASSSMEMSDSRSTDFTVGHRKSDSNSCAQFWPKFIYNWWFGAIPILSDKSQFDVEEKNRIHRMPIEIVFLLLWQGKLLLADGFCRKFDDKTRSDESECPIVEGKIVSETGKIEDSTISEKVRRCPEIFLRAEFIGVLNDRVDLFWTCSFE